jgi:hypothetical protein
MTEQTQVSAFVTVVTRERLDRYAAAHGLKKGAVIEAALLHHHLQALDEIPEGVIVPARIVLAPESFRRVVEAVFDPQPPTEAMKALMAGQPVKGLDG